MPKTGYELKQFDQFYVESGEYLYTQLGTYNYEYDNTPPQFVLDTQGFPTSYLLPKSARRSRLYPVTNKGDKMEDVQPASLEYAFRDPRMPGIPPDPSYPSKVFRVKAIGHLYGNSKAGPYPNTWSGGSGAFPSVMSDLNPSGRAYNQAVYKMQENIASRAQSLVSVLEAKKTMGMLTQTANTIYRAFRAVRRGRFKQAATVLGLKAIPKKTSRRKQFADNWLAYRYGWLPLYLDMYGHATAIFDTMNKPIVFRVSGRGSEEYKPTTLFPPFSGINRVNPAACNRVFQGQGAKYSYDVPHEVHRTYVADTKYAHVGCIFEITDASAFTAANFGVDNPLLVAWEVVPLSFVVDWFYNIGDWLGQLTAYRGLNFRSGFRTMETKTLFVDELKVPKNDASYQLRLKYTCEGKQGWCYHREQRSRLTALPYAQVVASNPLQVFSDMIGLKRFTDSVALISGQIKGYKRGNIRI